jgi:serine/threonine-protein kinase
MTVEYASPEQILGEMVTTATDVYALGLVLYELVTSVRPFDSATSNPLELQKRICTTDPPRPSRAVSDRATARILDGEIDDIILKAVRKEPKERYGSAELLSEDLKAWLDGFPVSATKGTTRYRALKFVRRHRLGIAVAVLFILLLAGFSVGMSVLALRLARERNTARQERERATQVSAFLSNLFQGADPYRAKGAELTARELLDEGSKRIQTNLKDQPSVRALVLDTMAGSYQHLADLEGAQRLFAAEADAYQQAEGPRSAGRADALRQLADVERQRGDLPAAEAHLREGLAIQQATLNPLDDHLGHTWNNLGLIVQARGRVIEARDLFRRAVEISSKYPREQVETLTMMSNLGGALADSGDFDEAEKVQRDVLQQRRATLGENHPQVLRTMNRLGHLLDRKGAYAEAELMLRTALASYNRILPPDYPDRLAGLNNLGHLLQQMHRLSEAEPLYHEAIDLGRRKLGEHSDVALWQSNLASVLAEKGEFAAAERLFIPSLALCRSKLGPGSVREAYMLSGMGVMYTRAGKYAEAESSLEQALSIRRQTIGPNHPDTADTLLELAQLRRAEGRLQDAEAYAREALRIDGTRPLSITASGHMLGLAEILMDRGDPHAAEPFAQKALELRTSLLPAESWQVKEARDTLAAIRRALGK